MQVSEEQIYHGKAAFAVCASGLTPPTSRDESESEPNRAKNERKLIVTPASPRFIGVYPSGKRWKAQIHFHNSQHYLGTFNTPEEAANAYDKAARAHHRQPKTNYCEDGTLRRTCKRRGQWSCETANKTGRTQVSHSSIERSIKQDPIPVRHDCFVLDRSACSLSSFFSPHEQSVQHSNIARSDWLRPCCYDENRIRIESQSAAPSKPRSSLQTAGNTAAYAHKTWSLPYVVPSRQISEGPSVSGAEGQNWHHESVHERFGHMRQQVTQQTVFLADSYTFHEGRNTAVNLTGSDNGDNKQTEALVWYSDSNQTPTSSKYIQDVHQRIRIVRRLKKMHERRLNTYGHVLSVEAREEVLDEIVVLSIQLHHLKIQAIRTSG